jgi:hypothetical protein
VASRRPRAGLALLFAVLAAATAHRLYLLAATDFPINDGGLFHAFITETARTFPAIPTSIAYNGLSIPYAYPPLAFWIGALLTRSGADPMAIVHVMPIALNALYVLLIALLLRKSGRKSLFVALALLFFCTQLRSFEWLVMGGGMSRGLGAVFLILTLLAVGVPKPGQRNRLPTRRAILAGASVAGAIGAHLEWGIDAAACVLLARMLGSAGVREFVRSSAIAGVTALLLILPWLATVYVAHGLAPLVAAGGSSPWNVLTFTEHFIWLIMMFLENPLIAIGLAILIRRRDFFWPGFLLICLILTPKHGPTPATLALAVLAAVGLVWLLALLRERFRHRWIAATATAAVALLLTIPQLDRNFLAQGPTLRPLKPEERRAMRWVAATHPGAAFLVLTGRPWWYDSSAEWFPVLARARSVNTLQGREWLPNHAYQIWFDRDRARRAAGSCEDLLRRLASYERPEFVWAETRQDCFTTAAYRPLLRDGVVTIFQPIQSARAETGGDRPDRPGNDQQIDPE